MFSVQHYQFSDHKTRHRGLDGRSINDVVTRKLTNGQSIIVNEVKCYCYATVDCRFFKRAEGCGLSIFNSALLRCLKLQLTLSVITILLFAGKLSETYVKLNFVCVCLVLMIVI